MGEGVDDVGLRRLELSDGVFEKGEKLWGGEKEGVGIGGVVLGEGWV